MAQAFTTANDPLVNATSEPMSDDEFDLDDGAELDALSNGMTPESSAAVDAKQDLELMSEEWMDRVRTQVREHPLATLAVAVVAGVALSRILSSSDDQS